MEQNMIRLPKLIGDGMVLQRNSELRIWGWAKPHQDISVNFLNQTYRTATDDDEKWMLSLPKMEAGGPYSMEITSGQAHITIHDILIGDVWVCSGQSNMELPMERVKDQYPDICANDEIPFIRKFAVPLKYDFHAPCSDYESGEWEPVSHDTILRFSAAGYFFAKCLYERYSVPIGLIQTAVGGSPVEAWLSHDALKKYPAILEQADQCCDDSYVQNTIQKEADFEQNWYNDLNDRDEGLNDKNPWYAESYDDSSWKEIQIPSYWADEGVPFVNGSIWFRKKIMVPASMANVPAHLWMGRIVDWDCVYVNGTPVGSVTYQYPPRKYEIPLGLLREGENTITVRVISNRGKGGFITEKPYRLFTKEQQIDLTGKWKFHIGAESQELPQTTFFQYKPLGLFNAMLSPLFKDAIKGVIWYQGESNTGAPEQYEELFTDLIQTWRAKWSRPELPFLFVQLPNYLERENPQAKGKWALVREAQRKALKLPHTAMAITIDIGEWNDLHPLNKYDVGKRLAIAARKTAYGESDTIAMGPLYSHMQVHGNQLSLHFTDIGTGIWSKDGEELRNFEIAGESGIFYEANAQINGDEVIVSCDKVNEPKEVRYAWCDSPKDINFYNREGLPASPFYTHVSNTN